MIVLGIDPGYRNIGISVLDTTRLTVLYCSTLHLQEAKCESRLSHLYSHLNSLITEYQVTVLSYEKPVLLNRGEVGLYVNYTVAVLLLLAGLHNLRVCEYSPGQVKQRIASSGKASKLEVKAGIKVLLKRPIEFCDDHSSDATALALTFLVSNL
jgi:crossover junction endodeoxyribonuclease RuvC